MRMGWLMTLVLVIAATMLPIAEGQAQAQETEEEQAENCSLPNGWDPTEDLPRILAEHRRWVEQWRANGLSEEWARKFPQGRANLCEARLNYANLTKARLSGTNLTATRLAAVILTDATYAPASPPPDTYVAGIAGLQTVVFPKGQETGVVQLRELLQKAGLRDLEREATFTLERGKTWHLLNLFDYWQFNRSASYQDYQPAERERRKIEDEIFAMDAPDGVVGFDLLGLGQAVFDHPQVVKSVLHHWGAVGEGLFRLAAFDLTTGYGLHPGRALWIILGAWAVLIFFYIWPIRREPYPSKSPNGIYRIWSTDRIETSWDEVYGYEVEIKSKPKIEILHGGFWFALGYAAYFSLLSAFHIGWRDINVGSWIARIQRREYTLRATGWVRVISGLQSLLSVYLLAIWALTYFGRPFQ
jgi:hypothetical protein